MVWKEARGQKKNTPPPLTAINPWPAPRAFHRLLEIFQKVSRDFSKNCSKVGLMLKYANCTTKVRFLSILCNFCQITFSSIKTKKCNEPIKLLNDLLHPRHSSQSSVTLRPPFWIFSKNRWPSSRLLLSCAYDLPQGEDLAPPAKKLPSNLCKALPTPSVHLN